MSSLLRRILEPADSWEKTSGGGKVDQEKINTAFSDDSLYQVSPAADKKNVTDHDNDDDDDKEKSETEDEAVVEEKRTELWDWILLVFVIIVSVNHIVTFTRHLIFM